MEYILIFISAIFVNNIILSQFLGICPFLGVSKKVDTSLGMSAAVAFVLTLATIVTWLVQTYVLEPNGQMPRNCDRMILLTNIALMKIKIYSIIYSVLRYYMITNCEACLQSQ